jgi:hypothetical protein
MRLHLIVGIFIHIGILANTLAVIHELEYFIRTAVGVAYNGHNAVYLRLQRVAVEACIRKLVAEVV